ncbi:putative surface protein with fasciclin (FAS1) repeats [Allocatelliglobosispora scoriae]|uniref:Putative surface protein with fasciclin (FAS1) repeats n=1 Tax=Allocatelliglobosispora scoriae TaxID=643052 RepID=A0A841BMP6_9ACTN|nr:fasciclin domain-containing protein [Allocatelliglobosispora scoriae]MBB5869534.1 putative surface protein with fasciclin (FAS1) repeats [Allocatelliglobosispora scoriae]
MRARRFTQIAASGALLLAIAACGSTEMTTSTGASASASAAASDEFGAGCAAVPTDPANKGSFEAMAKVPVATAASGNPLLSTLVTAVTKANLGDSLNSAKDITVFAPTNDAFAKIPAADLQAVLADNATLTKILTYHVVPGRLSPDQLAGTHKTLEGKDLTVTGSGTDFKVNGNAAVVCGNVQTGNATVYIIDSVLMP